MRFKASSLSQWEYWVQRRKNLYQPKKQILEWKNAHQIIILQQKLDKDAYVSSYLLSNLSVMYCHIAKIQSTDFSQGSKCFPWVLRGFSEDPDPQTKASFHVITRFHIYPPDLMLLVILRSKRFPENLSKFELPTYHLVNWPWGTCSGGAT